MFPLFSFIVCDAFDSLVGQLATYPSRVVEALRQEYSTGSYDQDRIFKWGLSIVRVGEGTALAGHLRQVYEGAGEGENVTDALEVFGSYAEKLIEKYDPEDVLKTIKGALGGRKVSRDSLDDYEAAVEGALARLPKEYAEVLNRLGVNIIVHDERNASHFANSTIYIRKDTFSRGAEYLQTVLKEEAIHYVDSSVGFTERPEWRQACAKALQILPETPEEEETEADQALL